MVKKILKFHSKNCGPCKTLGTKIEQLGIKNVESIDIEENAELANKYDVSSVPTLVFIENGAVVDYEVGFSASAVRKLSAFSHAA
jgi:thioredoxin 1